MTELHDPLPVNGYTEQSTANIERVNANKEIEESILRVIDSLENVLAVDKRWLAVGRTHIQLGFMAINRSIFKPQRLEDI